MSNKPKRHTTTQHKSGKPRRHTTTQRKSGKPKTHAASKKPLTKKQKIEMAKLVSELKKNIKIRGVKNKTQTKKVPTKKKMTKKIINILKDVMVKSKTPPKIQDKTCTNFCKNVFIPEKERVEKKASKHYEPIEVLRKKKDKFDHEEADYLENMYLRSCNDIYCQKKCNNKDKTSWVKTIEKKRKERLMEQGAISGCRDLVKEFPDYYENI